MGVLFVFWLTFCKQEFKDPRDADDARYSLDGRDFDGSRIIVEFARGVSFYQPILLILYVELVLGLSVFCFECLHEFGLFSCFDVG